MRAASYPRRGAQILTQRAEAELVLLCLDDGQYYALDEVGSRIWDLCDGTRSIAEIGVLLSQEFDAPAATIEADLLELLGELVDDKLVVVAEEPVVAPGPA
jgi:hypothetical protein